MSEVSEDKTKRKMISIYGRYEWSYQYSIFYDDPADSTHLLDDLATLSTKLRNNRKNQPFYIVKRLLIRSGMLQAYATMYTTEEISDFKSFVERSFYSKANIVKRKVSEAKLVSTIRQINNQTLHNLDGFFGVQDVKRYSVVNKMKLVERDINLSSDEDNG